MRPIKPELSPRQEQNFIPHILAGEPDEVLRQLYMKMRFRLQPERSVVPFFPHWKTGPEEVKQVLENIRKLGFTQDATERAHHFCGDTRATCIIHQASCGGFRMKYRAYDYYNTTGYRFALTTPAGDTWNYIASTGCKNVTAFIQRCMTMWEAWEEAWRRYLVRVQKIRKMDGIAKVSLDLILSRLRELCPLNCHISKSPGSTSVEFLLRNSHTLSISIPHETDMSTLVALPEELKELRDALNALTSFRLEAPTSPPYL